jgi:hypothetical protein
MLLNSSDNSKRTALLLRSDKQRRASLGFLQGGGGVSFKGKDAKMSDV